MISAFKKKFNAPSNSIPPHHSHQQHHSNSNPNNFNLNDGNSTAQRKPESSYSTNNFTSPSLPPPSKSATATQQHHGGGGAVFLPSGGSTKQQKKQQPPSHHYPHLSSHSPRGAQHHVGAAATIVPEGVSVVSSELQRKFAHGVNYNMKIVIRGDRNSGKTSLWRRLQGKPFYAEYEPTQEIQVASITWNYRTFDHIVKLEIWDVVDEGKRKRPPSQSLKLDYNVTSGGGAAADVLTINKDGASLCSEKKRSPSSGTSPIPPPSHSSHPLPSSSPIQQLSPTLAQALENVACDATMVDVYKNCCGVLLVFDVTKLWTWGYVERELARVPAHIPVLVMANKIDLVDGAVNGGGDTDSVRTEDCLHFLRNFHRPSGGVSGAGSQGAAAPLRFTRCSMKSAQGLRFLYTFFNVPFLHLQRATLAAAMAANAREMELAERELNLLDEEHALVGMEEEEEEEEGVNGDEDNDDDESVGGVGRRDKEVDIGSLSAEEEEREPIGIRAALSKTASVASSGKHSSTMLPSFNTAQQRPTQIKTELSSADEEEEDDGPVNKMVDMYEEDLESLDGADDDEIGNPQLAHTTATRSEKLVASVTDREQKTGAASRGTTTSQEGKTPTTAAANAAGELIERNNVEEVAKKAANTAHHEQLKNDEKKKAAKKKGTTQSTNPENSSGKQAKASKSRKHHQHLVAMDGGGGGHGGDNLLVEDVMMRAFPNPTATDVYNSNGGGAVVANENEHKDEYDPL